MHGWTSPHKDTAPINVPPPTIYAFRTRNNSDNMFIHMVIMLMTLLADWPSLAGASWAIEATEAVLAAASIALLSKDP